MSAHILVLGAGFGGLELRARQESTALMFWVDGAIV